MFDEEEEDLLGSDLSLNDIPLLEENGEPMRVQDTLELPSPNGDKYYIQPSPKLRRTLTRRPGSRNGSHRESIFQKDHPQPAYEDLAPFAVPDVIPDAPHGQKQDLGTLFFSISYDVFQLVLKIHVQKAINLPAKDLFGTSDPYVRVMLHPAHTSGKLQTRTRMRNLNPIWNEVMTFEGFSHDKLMEKSLMLKVLFVPFV